MRYWRNEGAGDVSTVTGAGPSGHRTPSGRLSSVGAEVAQPVLAPSPAPDRGLRYLVALDGLRGIAIIMVMLHNFTLAYATSPLGRALEWGWVGVQLFFVMSGYLITRNLLAANLTPGALTAFMVRRWLRVVPICYATLVTYFFVVPLLFDAPAIVAARGTQIWYWLFVSNWTDPFGLGAPGLGHLWSLAVEVQFYLAWPLVILVAGPRRMGRACATVIALGIAAAIALRLGVGRSSYMAVYEFTVTRMSALGMGGFVAILAQRPSNVGARIPLRRLAVGTSLALLAMVIWRRGFDYSDVVIETVGLPLIALLFTLWLLPIAGVRPGGEDSLAVRVPSSPPLQALGRVSYGMYVLHYPLHWAAMRHLSPYLRAADGSVSTVRLGAYVVLAGVATYLLARLSWAAVEGPLLALKHQFPPTSVRSPTMRIETLSARRQ